MVDHENGGFYGRIDGHNKLDAKANKSIILNTRILWTFSAAYQNNQSIEYKRMADRAFHYILNHFEDTKYGGFYWELDFQGNVVDHKKQTYAQSFAIYALSEYYKISKDTRSLELAKRTFQLIETNAFDVDKNGYQEALSQSWQKLDDVRLSEKDMNATKTMNTHLHILEAYTNLFRIWKSELLEAQLNNLIELMSSTFISEDYHLHLFFDDNWTLLSDEISFGHDIEASWLMHEAAEVLGKEELLMDIEVLAVKMVDSIMPGIDHDGGLMNEANPKGLVDTDKHWWPQAEALVGLYNAYQLTSNFDYLTQLNRIWDFTKTNLIDPEGEWHWRVDRNGVVIRDEDKAGPWKCPYHNSRAMLELITRIKSFV
ncbi:MAG: AGE family epimerase/isomerase [bacterium]|nr:AGE family epimerase/isomerase [bacterium]